MTGLDTKQIKPLIGSEVRADVRDLVAGTHARNLRELVVSRGVIVFRDLDVTLDQQRAITATLGPIQAGTSGDEVQKVTIDKSVSPEYATYFANTYFWHMDGYHDQVTPVFGGSFRPARLAPEGGETEFLSTYAAYEGLDAADKALIDGLHVIYSGLTVGLAAIPDADDDQIAAWRKRPRARQPLVWAHRDGRKSLMLGAAVSHVEGMHPADSYDLLARLRVHMCRHEYVYRHEWREGDLLVWNNTGTMHRARPFDPASGRLMNRFTLLGDEEIRAPSPVPA
ncbi:hypothetical protein B2G71_19040 [Novosphingobium sp. PC22D]|uniref:TauD/TfdA dioxygenase family protein n=1 Tax=Novosphingobium sp. PC22D TaxID=1962403 RepID=UPI000BF118CB|nr:TauD/TfdA family dioxygenase [Novosphingobium sp. PC22D]PEQ11135.1 hypothetical protein B2G71_19040 [Novosphingobium sp. PC22D]